MRFSKFCLRAYISEKVHVMDVIMEVVACARACGVESENEGIF